MFPINNNELQIDKELYQQFLAGDKIAFEDLVLKYKDQLILFINRFVKNIFVAEELAQDVFVDVYVYKDRYHFGVSFKTYLYTIGRNKAIDYIRKNKRILLVDEFTDLISEEVGLEDKVIKEENKVILYNALKKLKKEYQIAILLIDLEDMSYSEAATIMEKSDTQMKVLIHRARKGLEKVLKRDGFVYEK